MSEGNLPFFDDEAKPEEEIETVEEAVEVEPEAKGEPEPAPPAVSEDAGKHIPISALLDEREKRQALQREVEALRKAQQEQAKKPDFYEDPEGRLTQERTQVQQMLWNERLNTSEMVARQAHGDEAVTAATEAFSQEVQRNPALYMELQRQQNPYGFVVQWHKRNSFLSKIGDDPDAYIEAQIKSRLEAMQVQPKPAAPPPSLASAAASGGPKGPAPSGFKALFGDE